MTRRTFLRTLLAAPAAAVAVLAIAPTMATAPLEVITPIVEPGISMRLVKQYEMQVDQMVTRYDVLYGYANVRPEQMCRITEGA